VQASVSCVRWHPATARTKLNCRLPGRPSTCLGGHLKSCPEPLLQLANFIKTLVSKTEPRLHTAKRCHALAPWAASSVSRATFQSATLMEWWRLAVPKLVSWARQTSGRKRASNCFLRGSAGVDLGLGRIVALYHRSSTPYRIR
jgi:hypothetical protein